VNTEICGEGYSGAEAEEDAKRIESNVDDGDTEFIDEGGWEKVDEGEEPPCAHEDGVIDDRGRASGCACNVVAHEGGNKDGANQLEGSQADGQSS